MLQLACFLLQERLLLQDLLNVEEEAAERPLLKVCCQISFSSGLSIPSASELIPLSPTEPPGHSSCLHCSSHLQGVPSRLEPEDPPPLHLVAVAVVDGAAESSGGGSGAQQQLQSSVQRPPSKSAGTRRGGGGLRWVSWSHDERLCVCRTPSPAQRPAAPSSRTWCTGSTRPCRGSPCSPGSTRRGAFPGRAPPGLTMQCCSRA